MHGSVTFRHGVVGKVGLDSSLQNPNAKTFPLKHSTLPLPLLRHSIYGNQTNNISAPSRPGFNVPGGKEMGADLNVGH